MIFRPDNKIRVNILRLQQVHLFQGSLEYINQGMIDKINSGTKRWKLYVYPRLFS